MQNCAKKQYFGENCCFLTSFVGKYVILPVISEKKIAVYCRIAEQNLDFIAYSK